MSKSVRIPLTDEEAVKVEGWSKSQHLRTPVAIKKLVLDHIEKEKERNDNND